MDFGLSPDQTDLVSAVATLLERHAGAERARVVREAGGFDAELMDALLDGGFLDTDLEGAGALEAVLVTEAVAKAAGCVPAGARSLVVPAVLGAADRPRVAALVPDGAGLTRYAAAADVLLLVGGDAATSGDAPPADSATASGDAPRADSATTRDAPPAAQGAAAVPAADALVTPEASMFGFPLARVDTNRAAGSAIDGDALIRWWRIAVAAELVGTMDAALDMTVEHLRERRQFGRPLGSFQALQHRLSELHIGVEGARWLVRYAAAGGAGAEDAAGAAAYASMVAESITRETHQLSGAMGLTEEYDLYVWTMRLPTLRLELGDAGAHQAALARARWAA